jgi:AP-1 complex subunit gamma-1
VISAAKEALSRMPIVDVKVLQKRREDAFAASFGSAPAPKAATAAAPAPGGDLLDIFATEPTPAPAQNGTPAAGVEKSDLDLLSDIFAASAATPAPAPAAASGGYDPFGGVPQGQSAPTQSNPLDIFGAAPPAAAPSSTASVGSNPLDIFGAPPPAQQQSMAAPVAQQTMMGGPAAPANGELAPLIVPGFTHNGLTIEFECTKPEIWNKNVSLLIAKCKNAAPDAIYGFNLQCAVPKYVTMEMEPPSSTTIPVTGGNTSKLVTQKIKVTNSMLGTKNLMLKLKVSFTLQGNKTEHMATCSAFPAGQY